MTEIIVAVLAMLGTLGGSLGGILASTRLTSYRLRKLEEKVDAHNALIDRMYRAERKLEMDNHRITRLEQNLEVPFAVRRS